MTDVLEKLDEYARFGISHIRVIDPRRRRAFTYSGVSLEEVDGAGLEAGEVRLPLEELFKNLRGTWDSKSAAG